jgi:hypothetical protein
MLALGAVAITAKPAIADEGGVSFWVSGFFGSLAAAPQQPGFSLATIYYHTSVSAGGKVAFARQVHRGNITANLTGSVTADLDARAGSRLRHTKLCVRHSGIRWSSDRATGGSIWTQPDFCRCNIDRRGFIGSGGLSESVTGFGDLVSQFNVRWNGGVHNFMTYVTGNLTVGGYESNRLVNLGIGHNAIDASAGYTYFNPQTPYELSAVLEYTHAIPEWH